MILKGPEIARYLARPDPTRPALLIHGQDAMRVALKRAEAVAALTGPDAEAEMRLTRIPGASLRKDAATLLDELGDLLFQVDPEPWQLALSDAQVAVDSARLTVERSNESAAAAPLRLDAEQVELLELRVDGRVLAPHEYRFEPDALTIPLDAGRSEIRGRGVRRTDPHPCPCR